MNERGYKSADEIEREIRGTEAEIERTLDILQHKLSPGAVVDTVLRTSRESGAEFAANFGRSVRDNPLPITLIGTGLAWLMLSGRGNGRDHERMIGYSAHHDDESYPEREDANRIQRAGVYSSHAGDGEGYGAAHDRAAEAVRSARVEPGTAGARGTTEQAMGGYYEGADEYESTTSGTSGASAAARRAEERAREAAHTAQERARSLGDRATESAEGTRSKAGETYSGARSKAEEAYSGARSTAGKAYSGARATGERAGERVRAGGRAAYRRGSEVAHRGTARASDTAYAIGASLREHPLAAGALLAGIGAIVGALLPVTRREDELMGEHSDAVKARAAEAAEQQARRARDVAAAAADGARREAEARGLTPEALAKAAEQEVRRVAEDGKEVARAAMKEGEAAAKGDARSDEEKRSEEKRSKEKRGPENRTEERGDEGKPGVGPVYPRMQAAPSPGPGVAPATPAVGPAVTPPAKDTDPLKEEK